MYEKVIILIPTVIHKKTALPMLTNKQSGIAILCTSWTSLRL